MPKPPQNLAGLMGQPADPGSSYDEVLKYAQGLPDTYATPAPAPTPTPQPYQYATPDPMAQAQQLADRQGAAAQLSSPVTPALEAVSIPGEVWNYVLSILGRGKK